MYLSEPPCARGWPLSDQLKRDHKRSIALVSITSVALVLRQTITY